MAKAKQPALEGQEALLTWAEALRLRLAERGVTLGEGTLTVSTPPRVPSGGRPPKSWSLRERVASSLPKETLQVPRQEVYPALPKEARAPIKEVRAPIKEPPPVMPLAHAPSAPRVQRVLPALPVKKEKELEDLVRNSDGTFTIPPSWKEWGKEEALYRKIRGSLSRLQRLIEMLEEKDRHKNKPLIEAHRKVAKYLYRCLGR